MQWMIKKKNHFGMSNIMRLIFYFICCNLFMLPRYSIWYCHLHWHHLWFCFAAAVTFCDFVWTVCSPVCDEAYGSLEVPENTPVGTPLKDVKCKTSDKEGGELRYAIKSGNVHGKFGINSTSSVGTVYVYQAISFESRTVSFQVRKLIKYCSSTAKTSAYNSYSTEFGKKKC